VCANIQDFKGTVIREYNSSKDQLYERVSPCTCTLLSTENLRLREVRLWAQFYWKGGRVRAAAGRVAQPWLKILFFFRGEYPAEAELGRFRILFRWAGQSDHTPSTRPAHWWAGKSDHALSR